MKNILSILFIISVIFISVSYAYEAQKGKIDMHGGKSDSLNANSAFGMAIGIGNVLNKKGSNKELKDDKKFITLDEKEKIEDINK